MQGSLSSPQIRVFILLILILLHQGVSAEDQAVQILPFDEILYPSSIPYIEPDPGDMMEPAPVPELYMEPDFSFQAFSELPGEIPIEVLSQEQAFERPYNESAVLVQIDPGAGSRSHRAHTAIKARVVYDFTPDGLPGLELVALPDSVTVSEAVSHYQTQPGIIYAEPDYYRFSDRTPMDTDFWRQWGMLNTGQTYREGYATGLSGADGKISQAWDTKTDTESIIAVIDSGADYLHPDLQANIWTDPNTITYGYDATCGNLEPMDTASHGTHCAGIIGAVGDNGMGIAGVNWYARIMPARFLNSFGVGTVSDEIKAILWAVRNGAGIICCPFGGSHLSRAEYEAMRRSDALFICAAGNDHNNTDEKPYYPASLNLTSIISVAATDPADNLSDFSNYGQTTVDLAAPGVNIFSTMLDRYQPVPIWVEPFDSLQNWTVTGDWRLNVPHNGEHDSGITGYVDRAYATSLQPALLTLKKPLSVKGLADPVISYRWSMNGTSYRFAVEGSVNGIAWTVLDHGRGSDINIPFLERQCKIPPVLRQGNLYIRFLVDGDACMVSLDNITLSDGFGDLDEIRYGYMSGTSMACSLVSGAAGLLSSANPDATPAEIGRIILKSADPLPSLAGKTVTGGRLNLSAAMNTVTAGTRYHIRLRSGWNHVSVPYRLVNDKNTARDVFGSLPNVSGHSLYRFMGDSWITVSPDDQILPLASYWVYTEVNASAPLMIDPDQSENYTLNLTTGWNGIGIVGEEEIPAREALNPLSDVWTLVIGFNTTTQQSEEPIIRGGSGLQNDNSPLLPFQGYWIYMTRNGTYEKKEKIVVEETQRPLWPHPLR